MAPDWRGPGHVNDDSGQCATVHARPPRRESDDYSASLINRQLTTKRTPVTTSEIPSMRKTEQAHHQTPMGLRHRARISFADSPRRLRNGRPTIRATPPRTLHNPPSHQLLPGAMLIAHELGAPHPRTKVKLTPALCRRYSLCIGTVTPRIASAACRL